MHIKQDDLEIIDNFHQRHLNLLNLTVKMLTASINAVMRNRIKEHYQFRVEEQRSLLQEISIKHYDDSRLMWEFEGMIGIE